MFLIYVSFISCYFLSRRLTDKQWCKVAEIRESYSVFYSFIHTFVMLKYYSLVRVVIYSPSISPCWKFNNITKWVQDSNSLNFFSWHKFCFNVHDSSKTNWKSSFNFEFIRDIQSSTFFQMYDCWNNIHKIRLVLPFPKCGLPFLCF